MIKANPKVVRIEKAVASDVLETLQIVFRALGRFTQQEIALASGHTTYFQDIVIDYSNAAFPLGPWYTPGTTSPCDVNGDAATNVADVQLCVNQAIGVSTCTADINKDGACNVVDVQRVVNAALGGQCVTQ